MEATVRVKVHLVTNCENEKLANPNWPNRGRNIRWHDDHTVAHPRVDLVDRDD